MATIRNKFHEVGNWLNKISLGTALSRDLLDQEGLLDLPREELKNIIDQVVKHLGKVSECVMGADTAVCDVKPFIYEQMGGDTELPSAKPR